MPFDMPSLGFPFGVAASWLVLLLAGGCAVFCLPLLGLPRVWGMLLGVSPLGTGITLVHYLFLFPYTGDLQLLHRTSELAFFSTFAFL